MPRVCTVCAHPNRAAIDKALIAGEPNRRIATRYRLAEASLRRHKDAHLPATLATSAEAKATVAATDLLREVRMLRGKSYSLLVKAENVGDFRTALAGVREARACLELLAEMEGELDRRSTVNVLVVSPEWITVRAAILDALAAFPAARVAVAERLAALEPGT